MKLNLFIIKGYFLRFLFCIFGVYEIGMIVEIIVEDNIR